MFQNVFWGKVKVFQLTGAHANKFKALSDVGWALEALIRNRDVILAILGQPITFNREADVEYRKQSNQNEDNFFHYFKHLNLNKNIY